MVTGQWGCGVLMAVLSLFLLQCTHRAGCAPEKPQNITVILISPNSVRITWSVSSPDVQRYEVVYSPASESYKVVTPVAANVRSVLLDKLQSETHYRVYVTAWAEGEKLRSRKVDFLTMAEPKTSTASEKRMYGNTKLIIGGQGGPPGIFKVRGVEVTIVLIVLMVWAGAVLLFFNRWGKIRMLLPYQPDYKEQHKGTCPLATATPFTSPHLSPPQHHMYAGSRVLDCNATIATALVSSPAMSRPPGSPRHPHIGLICQQRSRLNSVYMFNSYEVHGHHTSPELKVHRKVKSAEHLAVTPLYGEDDAAASNRPRFADV